MALFGKDDSNRTEVTSFRLSRIVRHKLDQLTKWNSRASNNNTVIWLIEKEFRKQQRSRSDARDARI